ncbi:asparagine synthase C-terminal domain-containing protein [Caulobacter sp. RHG1]|uniref:asparagine synthase-related protein n=1 Tax=Caulobacter sp. (strain RHG1) TaxID=2545762 RepID=UPI0015546251|nr:asparagine synthase C-terminal domain-containing protein [Caulobacter sp. RHG1]
MVADLKARGWVVKMKAFALVVLTQGAAPPVMALEGRQGVGGVLIGRVHDRGELGAGPLNEADLKGLIEQEPHDACAWLIDKVWGGYVAVLAPDRREPPTVLRDPTGSIEAFVWRRDGVTVISSDLPEGLAAPPDLALDWEQIANILVDPARSGGALPLTGVLAVDPGACRFGPGGQLDRVLWSPARFAHRGRGGAWASRAELRACVDGVVASLAAETDRIVCEISGGLDSAIVATSLTAVGRPADHGINFFRDQFEADERIYAQDAAERAGVPLEVVRRTPFGLDTATLALSAGSVRPNFNALDPGYDQALSDALARTGAEVLFTGHGGDVVFLQVGAASLAADLLAGAPCEGSRLQRLAQVARRTRRSIWSLGLEAVRGKPSSLSPEGQVSPFGIVRRGVPHTPHPWVVEGVASGKRAQIGGLVGSLTLNGATRRAERARLAHPLLSQPVIELCLGIPATVLSAGETERSYARETFSDRLPTSIVERRSKGDISVFLGRSLAASLDFLRPFLLEGRLAAEGLIDTERLEAALNVEAMVWKDASVEILAAATLEAWIGHWEGRIAAAGRQGAEGAPLTASGPPNASVRKAKARR